MTRRQGETSLCKPHHIIEPVWRQLLSAPPDTAWLLGCVDGVDGVSRDNDCGGQSSEWCEDSPLSLSRLLVVVTKSQSSACLISCLGTPPPPPPPPHNRTALA